MSGNPEQLNDANREFEQISPTFSESFVKRFTEGFQVRTISPGIDFVGSTAYSSPGDPANQLGPSPISNFFSSGANGLGDPGSMIINLLNNLPNPTVPNPGTEPPVGPEERLRYSCLSGLCMQDPNGVYYGIDECLEAGCSAGGSSGGGGGGTSGGDGSGGGGSGGGGAGTSAVFPCVDRAFHCTFAAMIIGITNDCPVAGIHPSPTCPLSGTIGSSIPTRTYWKYKWIEVEQQADRETWCIPLVTNNPGRSGGTEVGTEAYNAYEQNVDDDGGSSPPASSTVTRKRIPNNWVVTMHVDQLGRAWFNEQNPVTVTCDTNFELILDGGSFDGAS